MNQGMMKLGRKAIKTDTRTLRLAKYFTAELPPPPPQRNWSHGLTKFGMLMNDNLGDCTIAGVGHGIQVFTANTATEASITDAMALHYYELWDGYNPLDPSTDQGGICLDVLNNWRYQGFAGHPLMAFASALPANQLHIQQAINLFGGVYIGVGLPITAQSQTTWHVVPGGGPDTLPGSWGGHCVFVLGYDPDGLTCVTWGQLKRMTWNFWRKYVDEVYCLLSPEFIGASGDAPSGFDLAQLQADLVQIN